jgi:hypothetical protein
MIAKALEMTCILANSMISSATAGDEASTTQPSGTLPSLRAAKLQIAAQHLGVASVREATERSHRHVRRLVSFGCPPPQQQAKKASEHWPYPSKGSEMPMQAALQE